MFLKGFTSITTAYLGNTVNIYHDIKLIPCIYHAHIACMVVTFMKVMRPGYFIVVNYSLHFRSCRFSCISMLKSFVEELAT